MKARILTGNCLETLKALPDNSVDAIVTDPPYGLSDSSQASPARVAAEFMLPQDAHFVTEGSGACVLAAFMRKIVQLHCVSIQPSEAPAVPVGAVAFDDQTTNGQHDIKHPASTPNTGADVKPHTTQHLGYLAFKAADPATFADMIGSSGGELQTGTLRIGLRVGAAGLPGLLGSCQVIDDSDPNVGALNDALAVCVSAALGAEDFAVPALALSGAAHHDLSASAALVLLGVAKLGGAQLVRAKPGTRGLSAKLQALRIRVIIPGADRALSFDLLVHPQGLARGGFMGKDWDVFTPGSEYWRECLRVAKPGAHIVAFSGTRTGHRLACALEDAGWVLRDCLSWIYGSGFPKSHNLTGEWQGWGTALKPAYEPIYLARKPFDGTVASNVLEHGTGAINVDACRIAGPERPVMVRTSTQVAASSMSGTSTGATSNGEMTNEGRWPANLCLDESAAAMLDEQTGVLKSGSVNAGTINNAAPSVAFGTTKPMEMKPIVGSEGGASRFFYVAKASRSEREKGLEGLPGEPGARKCTHPTVKPITLMQWLIRLITPPGGIVLDPFNGSGSTGCAAVSLGHRYIGCELNPEYVDISMARMRHWAK